MAKNGSKNVFVTWPSFIPCFNIHIAAGASHRTYTGIPTLYISMHREPNIIVSSARALPQETHQKRRKYHFIELFSSLKRNGWAACGSLPASLCIEMYNVGIPVYRYWNKVWNSVTWQIRFCSYFLSLWRENSLFLRITKIIIRLISIRSSDWLKDLLITAYK